MPADTFSRQFSDEQEKYIEKSDQFPASLDRPRTTAMVQSDQRFCRSGASGRTSVQSERRPAVPEKGSALLAGSGAPSARAKRRTSRVATGCARLVRAAVAARGDWLVPLAFGFLLSRATVLGAMKPFGVSYVIALAALGQHARALWATAGAMAGGMSTPGLAPATEPWPALLVAWCIIVGAGRWFQPSATVTALGAVMGIASFRVVVAAFAGDDLALAGVASMVEWLALLVFVPFVRLWTERPPLVSRVQLAALLTVLGLLVLGTENVFLYEYSVMDICMRVLLLLAALAGSLGTGAAAGAALGLLSVLSAGGLTWSTTLLAPSGLLAGLGGQLGRWGALVGLLTVHLLMSPYAPDGVEIARALGSCIIAGVLVALVPRRWLRALADALPPTAETGRERSAGERRAAAQTAAEEALRRVATVLENTGRGLVVPDGGVPGADGPFEQFVARVAEGVCAGCRQYAACWDTYVYRTYRDLTMAAASAARGELQAGSLPGGLRQRCIQPDHLAAGVNRLLTGWRSAAPIPGQDSADRELAAAASEVYRSAARTYASVAALLNATADEAARVARMDWHRGTPAPRTARFRLVVDVAQAAAGPVSGDSFRRVDLPGHRVALIISDGMGTGPQAAADSEAAATLMARFLQEGFDLQWSVRAINAALALRPADDRFATLDVCLFDLTDGTVRMLKTGAAPTYVRRGKHVDVVRADSLPVGIWHGVEAWTVVQRLTAGDLVVMLTDGALEAETVADDKAAAAARALQRIEQPDPHAAVDELFSRVRPVMGRSLKDDVTIVAARLLPR